MRKLTQRALATSRAPGTGSHPRVPPSGDDPVPCRMPNASQYDGFQVSESGFRHQESIRTILGIGHSLNGFGKAAAVLALKLPVDGRLDEGPAERYSAWRLRSFIPMLEADVAQDPVYPGVFEDLERLRVPSTHRAPAPPRHHDLGVHGFGLDQLHLLLDFGEPPIHQRKPLPYVYTGEGFGRRVASRRQRGGGRDGRDKLPRQLYLAYNP